MSREVKEEVVQYVLGIESLIKIMRDDEDEEIYADLVFFLASLDFDIDDISQNATKIELLHELCKRFSEIGLYKDE